MDLDNTKLSICYGKLKLLVSEVGCNSNSKVDRETEGHQSALDDDHEDK